VSSKDREERAIVKDVHLHVFSPENEAVPKYRDLRNWLRVDETDRALYADTKLLRAVLLDQSGKDPAGSMALLPRHGRVLDDAAAERPQIQSRRASVNETAIPWRRLSGHCFGGREAVRPAFG
jgi:hypothetical protein